jgi:hypothetical protein
MPTFSLSLFNAVHFFSPPSWLVCLLPLHPIRPVHSIYRPINEGAAIKSSGCKIHYHCPASPKRGAMDSISGPWGNSFSDGIPIMPRDNTDTAGCKTLSLSSAVLTQRAQ